MQPTYPSAAKFSTPHFKSVVTNVGSVYRDEFWNELSSNVGWVFEALDNDQF